MSCYDVAVVRKSVKNINLRIKPDGTVAVSAPPHVPLGEIERFVRPKDAWIRGRLAERGRRAQAEAESLRLVSNHIESFELWGEPHALRVCSARDRPKPCAELEGGALTIWLPDESDPSADALALAALRSWQAEELTRAIREILPDCEARVGKRASRIRIKQMKSRWGSCNVKTASISINLELVERPRCGLESVVVHELCHLWEANHGPEFYRHMDRAYPEWREARRLLNERPPRRGR